MISPIYHSITYHQLFYHEKIIKYIMKKGNKQKS